MNLKRLTLKPAYQKQGDQRFFYSRQNHYDHVLLIHGSGYYSVFSIAESRPLKGKSYQYLVDECFISPDNDCLSFDTIKEEFFISNDLSDIEPKLLEEIEAFHF